jgi:hypothetical protein
MITAEDINGLLIGSEKMIFRGIGRFWAPMAPKRDRLGALFGSVPDPIVHVMQTVLQDLQKTKMSDTNCLQVLQVDLATYLKNTYKDRQSILDVSSSGIFKKYYEFLHQKYDAGNMDINVGVCLKKGMELTMEHPDMSRFENKEELLRHARKMRNVLMSTIGVTLHGRQYEVPDGVKETAKFVNSALGVNSDYRNHNKKMAYRYACAKFGVLMMLVSIGGVVAAGAACRSNYIQQIIKDFYRGAVLARGAIGKVWALAFTYKIEQSRMPNDPNKQTPNQNRNHNQKQSWLAWLSHKMGRREKRLALPTPENDESAERAIHGAMREFGPMSETQHVACQHIRNVEHRHPVKSNTCPKKRRPNSRGKCPAGREIRLNQNGNACCYTHQSREGVGFAVVADT